MKRLDDAYFERIYADGHDPWGFESRWYEARKYQLTMAALPRQRYRRAFEPGCAIGVLSAQLAARCDALCATEPMAAIVARARERLAPWPGAKVEVGALPEQWPEGRFDLVVASEVLYYLTEEGLDEVLAEMARRLEPGGHLVAVHWRLETDYPLTGDAVHERLGAASFLERRLSCSEREFRLEVFERAP